jgi:hypothetical protein
MKNLENIPKRNIFEVPEGYFERLPGTIQARIASHAPKEQRPYLGFALRYALPVMLLAAIAIFVFAPENDPVDILSSVSTEQLHVYLDENGFTLDEILDQFEFDEASIQAIEYEVYSGFDLDISDLDSIDDIDISDF